MYSGRAVAQVVSRRLPTPTFRVRAQVMSRGICGKQSGIATGFLRVLLFPWPIIPPTAPHSSSSIIPGWYNRPVVASVSVDLVPLHRHSPLEICFRSPATFHCDGYCNGLVCFVFQFVSTKYVTGFLTSLTQIYLLTWFGQGIIDQVNIR
jgi:hypothetical protein